MLRKLRRISSQQFNSVPCTLSHPFSGNSLNYAILFFKEIVVVFHFQSKALKLRNMVGEGGQGYVTIGHDREGGGQKVP